MPEESQREKDLRASKQAMPLYREAFADGATYGRADLARKLLKDMSYSERDAWGPYLQSLVELEKAR